MMGFTHPTITEKPVIPAHAGIHKPVIKHAPYGFPPPIQTFEGRLCAGMTNFEFVEVSCRTSRMGETHHQALNDGFHPSYYYWKIVVPAYAGIHKPVIKHAPYGFPPARE